MATFLAQIGAVVNSPQALIGILDGAGNTIGCIASPVLNPGTNYTVTFAAAAVDSSTMVTAVSGSCLTVGIPADLWIQPQWRVDLQIQPSDALNTLSNASVTLDTPDPPKKEVAPAKPTGQTSLP